MTFKRRDCRTSGPKPHGHYYPGLWLTAIPICLCPRAGYHGLKATSHSGSVVWVTLACAGKTSGNCDCNKAMPQTSARCVERVIPPLPSSSQAWAQRSFTRAPPWELRSQWPLTSTYSDPSERRPRYHIPWPDILQPPSC